MATKRLQKRRKVWVNFMPGYDGGAAFNQEWVAIDTAAWRDLAVAVPFVEVLPGDVMLSREQAKRFNALVQQMFDGLGWGDGTDRTKNAVRAIKALFRGGAR